ncbi:MAG TPA: hypothetical protein VIQ30_17910 [Pseudonocardia sp.]
MTETKASDVADLEDQDQLQRPWWLMPVLLVWIGLVLAAYFAQTYAWGTTEPMPAPSYQPDECTAEDIAENGICLTWDDIRNQPTYTQAP